MNPYSQINTESVGKIHVVTFVANRVMDPIVIEDLGKELQSFFSEHPGGTFLLNMQNVEFLSSAVLNRLIVLDKSVKSSSGIMAFSNLSQAVCEVFAITKLDLLFKIYGNREEAIDALQ